MRDTFCGEGMHVKTDNIVSNLKSRMETVFLAEEVQSYHFVSSVSGPYNGIGFVYCTGH